jgi:HlyD family secretion protein
MNNDMKIQLTLIPAVASLLFISSCYSSGKEADASGTFEATEIIVSSEATGKIIQFDVEEGDMVDSGYVAGYIDSTQLFLKKKQLLATINAMNARRPEIDKQIAVIKDQIATQEREKERINRLLDADAATQKQLDDINSYISLLYKQLEAQSSSLANTSGGLSEDALALSAQVEQLEDQLIKCVITSPAKGTVLVKYAQKGEVAVAGKPLFKLADMEKVLLRAYITADIVTGLKQGQQVTVFADSGKDGHREYKGTIVWISDKAEFTPKAIKTRDERANLVYAVKIAVQNDGYLKIGMYGEVRL